MNKPEIIAEIGSGHSGDLTHARELIAAAAESGADCAKFQLIVADEIIHPRTGNVRLPTGAVPLYERFRALERPISFYAECAAECEKRGLRFLCTAFGVDGLARVASLGVARVKVASPELNHLPLLRAIAERELHAVVSTGVSRLGDIERAVDLLGPARTTILHCITAYPAPEHEYNLQIIPRLKALFGVAIGVSDHSLDARIVPGCALACGAAAIEKHFTLNRNGTGLDDPIALGPDEFRTMTQFLETLCTHPHEELEHLLAGEFGRQRVQAALGDGVKRLAPSERQNYGRSNRSLHALVELSVGDPLNRENCALLRSEHNLRPGIAPEHFDSVLGARVSAAVPPGEGIRWDDLLQRG